MRTAKVYPDTVTYTTFINLLKKDREVEKAWLVFHKMREENVRPNEWTYSTMAHICALKRYVC
jgi:pentatricopeptide repeat protein